MAKRRLRKNQPTRINLIPIMDATFIFIFFLLMSVNFTKINEVGSVLPIISDQEPPPNKKPLALSLNVDDSSIIIQTGVPAVTQTRIGKNAEGEYDLLALHDFLIKLKQNNPNERSIVINPLINLEFEILVRIMDAVRLLEKTDEAIFSKNKDGVTEKVLMLFDQIIFGNTVS